MASEEMSVLQRAFPHRTIGPITGQWRLQSKDRVKMIIEKFEIRQPYARLLPRYHHL